DLEQPLVDIARALAQRPESGLDERAQLLDRPIAKERRRVADEVLPELARRFLDLGWGTETHKALLEALRLEAARERLLDDEDDAVAALLQHLADGDTVVRRPVRALRKENERLAHRSRPDRPAPIGRHG